MSSFFEKNKLRKSLNPLRIQAFLVLQKTTYDKQNKSLSLRPQIKILYNKK